MTLKSFFHFCAGIHPSLIKRTPTDSNKYVGIGATIFFTGIFAAIAGGFALFTVFKSIPIALIFGILWGLMIFNLDRFIVMSMKKKESRRKEFMVALPRIILAVLIAFVIAKPLELKLFESEIKAELISMEQGVFKKQEDLLKTRFTPEIDSLKNEVLALNADIESKREQRDALNLLAIQEADGTGGSKQKNLGPIYKAKKKDADLAQAELDQTMATLTPLIEEKQAQISTLENDKQSQLTAMEKTRLDGFAAQLDALGNLAKRSSTIWFASLFITLLFIAIETAPIFAKLISDRSPYDYKLDEHELLFAFQHKKNYAHLDSSVSNQVLYEKEVNKHKTLVTIAAEKEIQKAIIAQEVEKLKEKPLGWKAYLKGGNLFGTS